jgi:hypothetical protein
MRYITIIILAGAMLFSACKKEETIFDGPSLNDIYGEFSLLQPLEVNSSNVDFEAGQTAVFTAEFSKNVSWILKITGTSSGAVKEITGFSKSLDASNATWNGTTTNLPMFKAEDCTVELSFENEEETYASSITVDAPKVNTGLLLEDFEGEWNPGWGSFVQAGADMSFVIKTDGNAAQGNGYYDMGGEVGWDYLIGLIDIPGSAYGAPTFDLSSNPDNVYFNVLLAKQPTLNNALVLFQFREDENGDGVYTEGEEDLYSIEMLLNGENGWQLVSRKYADLVTLINGEPAAAIGNGINEPDKLIQVSILMLANPATGYSQTLMDYMIFTENGPLQP